MEQGFSNVGRRLRDMLRVARVSTDAIIQAVSSFKDLTPESLYLRGNFKNNLLKALAGLLDDKRYLLDAFVGVIELLGIYYNPRSGRLSKLTHIVVCLAQRHLWTSCLQPVKVPHARR